MKMEVIKEEMQITYILQNNYYREYETLETLEIPEIPETPDTILFCEVDGLLNYLPYKNNIFPKLNKIDFTNLNNKKHNTYKKPKKSRKHKKLKYSKKK